jgi:hypothetical protein
MQNAGLLTGTVRHYYNNPKKNNQTSFGAEIKCIKLSRCKEDTMRFLMSGYRWLHSMRAHGLKLQSPLVA